MPRPYTMHGTWHKGAAAQRKFYYFLILIHVSLARCIVVKYKKTFKNEQRNRDDTAKKRVNTSGVGESNNYYEDIYNIYTSLQQHSLTTPIDSTH